MELLKKILNTLPKDAIPVRNVIVGVHWTLVSSKYCALGSTIVGEGPHGHSKIRDVGFLQEKSAQELAQWALSENLMEASIGMAAINSLLDLDEKRMEEVNASEVIAHKSEEKNLVVVGHFPFVDRIRTITKNCWVIEKKPYGDDFPEEACSEFIPQADVIAITGTAFINHSMENLLSLCQPESMVVVLGPSTPMTPLLFEYGISFLSGSRVIDEAAAIHTIQQGASFPQVKGTRLLTMSK